MAQGRDETRSRKVGSQGFSTGTKREKQKETDRIEELLKYFEACDVARRDAVLEQRVAGLGSSYGPEFEVLGGLH